jgi:Leucine Rich Repeat (LRR) protein
MSSDATETPLSQEAGMPDQAKPVSRPWRRFLRLSVRGLIVLVLVIGAGLGWIARQAHVQCDAVEAIKKAGGRAYYDINPRNEVFSWSKLSAWRRFIGEYIGIDFVFHVVYADVHFGPESNAANSQQALARLGDLAQLEQVNLSGKSVTDGDLARVAGLKHLELLMLQNTGISDAGLTHVRALTSLQEIYITSTGIGDDGLNHLTGLTNLKHLTYHGRLTDVGMERLKDLGSLQTLHLGNAQVSDAGLRHLMGLSNLRRLSLYAVAVTDSGLVHLRELDSLSSLDLRGTQVTDAGMKGLQQALPSLKIVRH